MKHRILVLGADGFIGRHIAFALRSAGHEVLAQARRTDRLEAMGFATLAIDLTDPRAAEPAFWRRYLPPGAGLVIAAGLLTGSEAAFEAVHLAAPRAALAALPDDGGRAVLISAVGIDQADTPFARWRRHAEAMAAEAQAGAGVTILRPGLVLADTSYGVRRLCGPWPRCPFARRWWATGASGSIRSMPPIWQP